tara:strand:+ start:3019 stop:3369 length:351 start_codon:yes stop_codon:yes gene_type:complete
MLKAIIKLTFYLSVLIILALIILLTLNKQYLIISVILGLVIIGEISHYLRKSREKSAGKKKLRDKKVGRNIKHNLNKKSKNKNMLEKPIKNKNLLTKTKNIDLLKTKKIKAVKLKN